MSLHDVHRGITKNKKRRRIGRGPGSGHGKTSGHGHKGQKSRAGASSHPIFQGGAMPLVRRVPKRGFHNKFALIVVSVNVSDLESRFEAGEEITPEVIAAKSLVKSRFDLLKILGDGQIVKKFKVCAHRFSKPAKEKIEKAGGTCVVLKRIISVEEKKKAAKQAAKQAAQKTS